MLGIPYAKYVQIKQTSYFLVLLCWELSVNQHSWQSAYHMQKWAHLKDNTAILASLFYSGQQVTHTPWDSLHSTCWNVFDQTSYSSVRSLYDFLVFGFLNKVPKGCKVGLDRNLKLAVEQCFYQQNSVSAEGPICWYLNDLSASVTTETIFSGLYCFSQNNHLANFAWICPTQWEQKP